MFKEKHNKPQGDLESEIYDIRSTELRIARSAVKSSDPKRYATIEAKILQFSIPDVAHEAQPLVDTPSEPEHVAPDIDITKIQQPEVIELIENEGADAARRSLDEIYGKSA